MRERRASLRWEEEAGFDGVGGELTELVEGD
jgi:hypothetical protein